MIGDFGPDPPLTPGLTYKLCVYDGDGLVAGLVDALVGWARP